MLSPRESRPVARRRDRGEPRHKKARRQRRRAICGKKRRGRPQKGRIPPASHLMPECRTTTARAR